MRPSSSTHIQTCLHIQTHLSLNTVKTPPNLCRTPEQCRTCAVSRTMPNLCRTPLYSLPTHHLPYSSLSHFKSVPYPILLFSNSTSLSLLHILLLNLCRTQNNAEPVPYPEQCRTCAVPRTMPNMCHIQLRLQDFYAQSHLLIA